jgi:hypothetical protein
VREGIHAYDTSNSESTLNNVTRKGDVCKSGHVTICEGEYAMRRQVSIYRQTKTSSQPYKILVQEAGNLYEGS